MGLKLTNRFPSFSNEFGAEHNILDQHWQKSNRLANTAVKNMKYLLQKCLAFGKDHNRLLYQLSIALTPMS
jgi:hypothetical protein